MPDPWSLFLVASRPSTSWAALHAATIGQTAPPRDVLILDAGPDSITRAYETRFVLDALLLEGILPTVMRVPRTWPLWQLRGYGLSLLAGRDVVGMLDDDVLWPPSCAARCVERLASAEAHPVAFVCAEQISPSQESGLPDWQHPFIEGHRNETQQVATWVEASSGHALFFCRDLLPADPTNAIAGLVSPDAGSDRALCTLLMRACDDTPGVRLPVRALEMNHLENRAHPRGGSA